MIWRRSLDLMENMSVINELLIFKYSGPRFKGQKYWIRELTNKHKISFLSLQETKKESFTDMEIKYVWGNYQFAYVESESLGLSGGIL